jgi:hypothetical protein
MKRSKLRRRIERLAIASLLGGACGTPQSPTQKDMQVVVPSDGGLDLACPVFNDGCTWLAYVDGGMPADNVKFWHDGGVDPCLPCGFESMPGAVCGSCEVVRNPCGVAYFCTLLDCSPMCNSSGRRPAGLILPSLAGAGLGAALARMAHLEAASVPAFAQLERELAAHGAPARLIAGARRARDDERRHARLVGDLARAAGARSLSLEVTPTPLRPLGAIALENAVEGCVRETAGAVMAALQARLLGDHATAGLFADIAVDERRHANLAWAIDAWITPRLAPEAALAVERARSAAMVELLSVVELASVVEPASVVELASVNNV